jgi:hypothetical protein
MSTSTLVFLKPGSAHWSKPFIFKLLHISRPDELLFAQFPRMASEKPRRRFFAIFTGIANIANSGRYVCIVGKIGNTRYTLDSQLVSWQHNRQQASNMLLLSRPRSLKVVCSIETERTCRPAEKREGKRAKEIELARAFYTDPRCYPARPLL